jgi:hypothetical protein
MQQYPPQQQGYPVQQIQQIQLVPVMMVPAQPQQPAIDRSDLMNYEEILVKQTKKGWCQELMGCEANTEFKIAAKATPTDNVLYAIEDTSCCLRFFMPSLRPFAMHLSKGGAPGGEKIASFERAFGCPLQPCKCCCFQEIVAFRAGTKAGSVVEGTYCCVPTFKVIKTDGTHQYDIHQPTCCGGCCVDVCAEGCCNCRIPFYIYPPGASGDVGTQTGKIVKVELPLPSLPSLTVLRSGVALLARFSPKQTPSSSTTPQDPITKQSSACSGRSFFSTNYSSKANKEEEELLNRAAKKGCFSVCVGWAELSRVESTKVM